MRKVSAVKECITQLIIAALILLSSNAAYATCNEMKVSSQGGLCAWSSENGDYWFKLTGLLQADQILVAPRSNNDNKGFPSGANIREARLGMHGGVGCQWSYDILLNFDKSDNNGAQVPQFYQTTLSYTGVENTKIVLGQKPLYLFMAEQVPTQDRITLEVPLPTDALYPQLASHLLRKTIYLGIGVEHYRNGWTMALGLAVPGNGLAAGQPDGLSGAGAKAQSDLATWHGRLTFAPLRSEGRVFHVGTSGVYQRRHAKSHNFRHFGRIEVIGRDGHWDLAHTLMTSSANFQGGIESLLAGGLEMATVQGPLTVQGEYLWAIQKRLPATAPATTPAYRGAYINAAYTLTGENRGYDPIAGLVGGITPCSANGALEIFGQYSNTNLRYRGEGPIGRIVSTGLNWYYNERMRFTAEYLHIHLGRLDPAATTEAGPVQRRLNVVGLRAEARWQ